MQSAIRSLGGARSLVVVIATLLVCLSYMTSCDARAVRNRSNRRLQRNRGQDAQPQPEYWICPQVFCQPLTDTCERIEYIVFQYEYTGHDGKQVSVRCESCEYCLDMPTSLEPQGAAQGALVVPASSTSSLASVDQQAATQRARRSLFDTPTSVATNPCPELRHCPPVTPFCTDERLTMVILDNRECRRCLACFDNTIFHTNL